MARNHIILKFLLLSAAAHTLALASWPTQQPPKTRISATLSVGFAALEPAATSLPASSATPVKAKSSQPSTTPTAKSRSAPRVTPQPVPTKRQDRQRRTSSAVATTATRSAQRSETLVAKADQTQQGSEISHNLIENSAPVTARPWGSTRDPVRDYSAEQQIRTANTAAALLHQQQRWTTPSAGVPNTINTSEAARALIRGHLETDLSRYFSYPPIARQRGWQGHVRVAFTVQADGQLTDARITHSSGYHVLDASALEALRRVGRLPQAREWLQGEALAMELPVIYRLEN